MFCMHSWASKKKKKERKGKKSDVLFLFDAFDLSHLSVEHSITSDRYQGKVFMQYNGRQLLHNMYIGPVV